MLPKVQCDRSRQPSPSVRLQLVQTLHESYMGPTMFGSCPVLSKINHRGRLHRNFGSLLASEQAHNIHSEVYSSSSSR